MCRRTSRARSFKACSTLPRVPVGTLSLASTLLSPSPKAMRPTLISTCCSLLPRMRGSAPTAASPGVSCVVSLLLLTSKAVVDWHLPNFNPIPSLIGYELGNEPTLTNLPNKNWTAAMLAAEYEQAFAALAKTYKTRGDGTPSAPWFMGPDATPLAFDRKPFLRDFLGNLAQRQVWLDVLTYHFYYAARCPILTSRRRCWTRF